MRSQFGDLKVIWLCSQVSPSDVSTGVNDQIWKLSMNNNKSNDKKVPVVLAKCLSSLFHMRTSVFQCRQPSQCRRNPLMPPLREEKRWHCSAGPQALLSPPSPGTGRSRTPSLCPASGTKLMENDTRSHHFFRKEKHCFWILFKKLLCFCFLIHWLDYVVKEISRVT